jgi:dTDP-4-dehydrorhamnose 3,5-epimerase
MDNEKINFVKLETHVTKDIHDQHINGNLTVIWRDWDEIIKDNLSMIYVSSVNSKEIKGPHLHTKRNTYFVCIHGKVVFVAKDEHGKYIEIESGEDNPVLVSIPKNYASAHINLSDKISRVLVFTDIAWKPNDNEMKNVSFDDYDWSKWNNTT